MKLLLVIPLISTVCAFLVPQTDFRTPKHIAFASVGGGSSHNVWILKILEELHSRNHTVTFLSRGDSLRFANNYPMISTYEVGGPLDFARHSIVQKSISSHADPMDIPLAAIESVLHNYTEEFNHIQHLSKRLEIDMFLCDSFAITCIDAALATKKPVMITSTVGIYSDLAAPYINNNLHVGPNPTTINESAWQRIYRDYIRLPLRIWGIKLRSSEAVKTQHAAGFPFTWDASTPRYNDIGKLIHNVFGIEVARGLTPLDHYVGPIMSSHYPELDNLTETFLNNHRRVVYVSFGQHAQAAKEDVQQILPYLLQLKKEGWIDGIIWARLPPHMLDGEDSDILLPGWASQFAILQHPSTLFFVSHGGAGSIIESLYSGVRLFVYPFFGDQPTNARAIKQIGLGDYFDVYSDKPIMFYDRLLRVAADPEGKIQRAVDRFKAYVQVSSINGAAKAADLVEESMFASDEEGKQRYRRHVKTPAKKVKKE
ncbi:hypothetical protein G6F38_001119 [Rhizopus arrhizus]|nr:hypothetical protein G6F38_001119 [Rhizopus arrhizus]